MTESDWIESLNVEQDKRRTAERELAEVRREAELAKEEARRLSGLLHDAALDEAFAKDKARTAQGTGEMTLEQRVDRLGEMLLESRRKIAALRDLAFASWRDGKPRPPQEYVELKDPRDKPEPPQPAPVERHGGK